MDRKKLEKNIARNLTIDLDVEKYIEITLLDIEKYANQRVIDELELIVNELNWNGEKRIGKILLKTIEELKQ
jgi:hypothetical protein